MTKITKEQVEDAKTIIEEVLRSMNPDLFKAFIFKGCDEDVPSASGIEKMVCEDITRRQQEGVKKYGTTVGENPLTTKEWQQHLYEELLDAAIYQKKLIESTPTTNDVLSSVFEAVTDVDPDWLYTYKDSNQVAEWIRDNCKQNKKEDDGWILNTGEPPSEFLGGLFDLILRNGSTTRALEWDCIRWDLEDSAYDVMKYRKSRGNE